MLTYKAETSVFVLRPPGDASAHAPATLAARDAAAALGAVAARVPQQLRHTALQRRQRLEAGDAHTGAVAADAVADGGVAVTDLAAGVAEDAAAALAQRRHHSAPEDAVAGAVVAETVRDCGAAVFVHAAVVANAASDALGSVSRLIVAPLAGAVPHGHSRAHTELHGGVAVLVRGARVPQHPPRARRAVAALHVAGNAQTLLGGGAQRRGARHRALAVQHRVGAEGVRVAGVVEQYLGARVVERIRLEALDAQTRVVFAARVLDCVGADARLVAGVVDARLLAGLVAVDLVEAPVADADAVVARTVADGGEAVDVHCARVPDAPTGARAVVCRAHVAVLADADAAEACGRVHGVCAV